jgi:hypothetical protein
MKAALEVNDVLAARLVACELDGGLNGLGAGAWGERGTEGSGRLCGLASAGESSCD